VTLVRDVSKVLVDLGMAPITEIPQDPRMASDILAAVDVILEHLKEAYESGHDRWALLAHHRRRLRPPCNGIFF
jgi:hypothetical protein